MVDDVHVPQCNEAYTMVQLPASASSKGTASLHVKVDTGAGGNVLPLHVFSPSLPKLDQPRCPAHWPGSCLHEANCIQWIPYTPIWGTSCPIIWWPGGPGAQPHKVNSYWHVADTPSPAIQGLPSCKRLAVVKMNCAVTII